MKRILYMALALCMMLRVSACGASRENHPANWPGWFSCGISRKARRRQRELSCASRSYWMANRLTVALDGAAKPMTMAVSAFLPEGSMIPRRRNKKPKKIRMKSEKTRRETRRPSAFL